MSKAGKEKFTDPGQKEVKTLLNERFGEAVFYSTAAPAKSTRRYLDELRQAMSNKEIFESTRWRIFKSIGAIDFDGFKRYYGKLEDGSITPLYETVDYKNGKRKPIPREVKAGEVLHHHIKNVEQALARMEKKPFDRNLNWLYFKEPDIDTLKSRMAWLRKRADEECEKLRDSRFPMPFLDVEELQTFVHAEKLRFGKLFEPDHFESNWQVLHDYPQPTFGEPIDLAELYITCQNLINNQEATIISSEYRGRWTLLAMAKGIQAYLKYLDEQLFKENNKEETATAQVPDPEPLDDRIHLHPKVLEYVKNCFSQLKFDEDWGGLKAPIMAIDDIKYLIQSNFLTEKPLKRRTFKANIKHKGELHYFFGLVFRNILDNHKIPSEGLQPSDIVDFVWENFPDARPPKKDSLRRSMKRCPESSTGKVEGRINEYLKDLKKDLGIKT